MDTVGTTDDLGDGGGGGGQDGCGSGKMGMAETAGDLSNGSGGGGHDGSGSGTAVQVMEDGKNGSGRPAARTNPRPSNGDWAAMTGRQQKSWGHRKNRQKKKGAYTLPSLF